MHIGSSISHYKIVEKLGEGGMGIVYKAADTKLNREVALKFLADHLLSDPEAKERFLREAQAAAALHHPNVCPVYEIDEVDGKTFLAMAFLEGESLEDRIAQGPLAIKDALDIARQVADGLDAAHAKGIVHRDIKPANIMVDGKGHATIMDFGLARLTEASRLTKVDTAMGTVAYMSPEQAQGMEVDSRSDLWSLGCVLYEMVSGQRPFKGVYDQALIYEIVNEEPAPLTSIRARVPMELEFLVGECLTKDRNDRIGTAKEVARKLRTLAERSKVERSTILRTTNQPAQLSAAPTVPVTLNPIDAVPADSIIVRRGRYRGLQLLASAALIALFGVVAFRPAESPSELRLRRFSLDVGSRPLRSGAVISPDGKYVLLVPDNGESGRLWLHSLGDNTARELPGTEGVVEAFWSPDSLSIGFAVGVLSWSPDGQLLGFSPGRSERALKKIDIRGGPAVSLCSLPNYFGGGTWSPDGEQIVFSTTNALYAVPAKGGETTTLLTSGATDRNIILAPHFLPSEASQRSLVYAIGRGGPNDQVVELLNLTTGESNELVSGAEPVYSAEGYLIVSPPNVADAGLRALPFSVETLAPTGEAFPISDRGRLASIADDGTLAYVEMPDTAQQVLVWRDRRGELIETIGEPRPRLNNPSLSPDGRSVSVLAIEDGSQDIWVYDLSRYTTKRITFGGLNCCETWSVSGQEILFRRVEGSVRSILRKPITDFGAEVVVLQQEVGMSALDLSRDGRYLVWQQNGLEGGQDIGYVELDANGNAGKPGVFVGTAASEDRPRLSPDGHFIAYMSNETGRYEVYVQPFPSGVNSSLVSAHGGTAPRWRSDGRELYYLEGQSLVAVSVSSELPLALGPPHALFSSNDLSSRGGVVPYDVSRDGQRFLTVTTATNSQAPPKVHLVQNWYEEFRTGEKKH